MTKQDPLDVHDQALIDAAWEKHKNARPVGSVPARYIMLTDSKLEPTAIAGSVVYRCVKSDYGMASDDARMTGKPRDCSNDTRPI